MPAPPIYLCTLPDGSIKAQVNEAGNTLLQYLVIDCRSKAVTSYFQVREGTDLFRWLVRAARTASPLPTLSS